MFDGVPAFPQEPIKSIAVIAGVNLKRLEGVTSGWYGSQSVGVPWTSRRLRDATIPAATTTSRPITHAVGAHDVGVTATGTACGSVASCDDSAGITGPAFVVAVYAPPSGLPFPTTTAPIMPGWYVQT